MPIDGVERLYVSERFYSFAATQQLERNCSKKRISWSRSRPLSNKECSYRRLRAWNRSGAGGRLPRDPSARHLSVLPFAGPSVAWIEDALLEVQLLLRTPLGQLDSSKRGAPWHSPSRHVGAAKAHHPSRVSFPLAGRRTPCTSGRSEVCLPLTGSQ